MTVGLWVWNLFRDLAARAAFLDRCASHRIAHLVLKVLDGERQFNGDSLRPFVRDAQARGLHVWTWGYAYDERAVDPVREGRLLAERSTLLGANGLVVDVEKEWHPHDPSVVPFVRAIRAAYGGPLYASSYATRSGHPDFPWDEFGAAVDGWMPQVYGTQPSVEYWVAAALREFGSKPVIPTGNASTQIGSEAETRAFLAACRKYRVASCNLWEAFQMTEAMWRAATAATA